MKQYKEAVSYLVHHEPGLVLCALAFIIGAIIFLFLPNPYFIV